MHPVMNPNKQLSVVLWCSNAHNQRALACKVAERFNLSGIVIEEKQSVKMSLGKLLNKVIDMLFFSEITSAWFSMLNYYNNKFPEWPHTKTIRVASVNTTQVKEFTTSLAPQIIMVSGTSLIKKDLLSLKPDIGIINLHTGLSPYVKGGPNCTNWCIANNEFELIGNSIMWIDEGIDSGNLIATSRLELNGNENLSTIHIKVMEQAHDLFLQVLHTAQENPDQLNNVPQITIAKGKTYFNRMWNYKAKTNLLRNMKHRSFTESKNITLVSLPDKN